MSRNEFLIISISAFLYGSLPNNESYACCFQHACEITRRIVNHENVSVYLNESLSALTHDQKNQLIWLIGHYNNAVKLTRIIATDIVF